ncbi:MAG TPA: MerR family DNA-binding protein [Arenicellales bacterium]|nr:MerR family DNA-binding protein [Arenicellales bacterium]
MATLTRGQLARICGVGPETIRFYERRGLLPEAPRSSAGYRRFGEDSVKRLRFIRRAKSLGFSLPEISELLALQDEPGGDRARVKQITESKLREIEAKISDLESMRAALSELAEQCSGHGPVSGCPIIETLADGDAPAPAAATPDKELKHNG